MRALARMIWSGYRHAPMRHGGRSRVLEYWRSLRCSNRSGFGGDDDAVILRSELARRQRRAAPAKPAEAVEVATPDKRRTTCGADYNFADCGTGDQMTDDRPRTAAEIPEAELAEMIRAVIGQTLRPDIAERALAWLDEREDAWQRLRRTLQ